MWLGAGVQRSEDNLPCRGLFSPPTMFDLNIELRWPSCFLTFGVISPAPSCWLLDDVFAPFYLWSIKTSRLFLILSVCVCVFCIHVYTGACSCLCEGQRTLGVLLPYFPEGGDFHCTWSEAGNQQAPPILLFPPCTALETQCAWPHLIWTQVLTINH